MALVCVFVADQFPPFIVGVECGMGVPRVVQHLRTRMEVGGHRKFMVTCKVHQPLGFILIAPFVVGMRTFVEVGIVAVEVEVVGIVAAGARYALVATVIGAVGVGVWADENVQVVD